MPSSTIAQEARDAAYMQMALELAAQAAAAGEVPVGAVVVKDGVVLGTGHNCPIADCDPCAHAEVLALRSAARALGNYRLDGCTLYVTLEPCAMCCGAMLHSRLARVVYAAADPKTGCAGSVLNLFAIAQLNHQTHVQGGVLAEQAAPLLQGFFQQRRANRRALTAPVREDALRTPESRFQGLTDFPWAPRYVCDLPSASGLRLHYLDEGPRDAEHTYLALHPVDGWSYSWRAAIGPWLAQGARVLLPDLLGFGKSDKPKRESDHTADWHAAYLLEWLDRLQVPRVVLVVPDSAHPMARAMLPRAPSRFAQWLVQPIPLAKDLAQEQGGLNAPYPDAGHRAAARAWARWPRGPQTMQS